MNAPNAIEIKTAINCDDLASVKAFIETTSPRPSIWLLFWDGQGRKDLATGPLSCLRGRNRFVSTTIHIPVNDCTSRGEAEQYAKALRCAQCP